MLVVACMLKGWKTYSWDIDSAFLHGFLKEEIYMRAPSGYDDPAGKGKVFKLKKTLYGLKQAAAEWHLLLASTLRDIGYKAADASDCLWVKQEPTGETCIVCHHVEDCAVGSSCDKMAADLKAVLKDKFGLSDGGSLTWHLGMNVRIVPKVSAHISQRPYIEAMLTKFGMGDCKTASTPMSDTTRVDKADCPEVVDEALRLEYMQKVGSVMYAAHMTRPDIAFACSQLGGVLQNPGPEHMKAVNRVLRYLAGTLDRGLSYSNKVWNIPGVDKAISPSELACFTDADWAGDCSDRLSTSCYLSYLAGGVVSYKMVKQKVHAMSSAESELISLSSGARDAEYIRNTLKALGVLVQAKATNIYTDSSSALAISEKSGMNDKTKHIQLRYYQVRKLRADQVVLPVKIGTDYNPSDVGTKALGLITFARHRDAVVSDGPIARTWASRV